MNKSICFFVVFSSMVLLRLLRFSDGHQYMRPVSHLYRESLYAHFNWRHCDMNKCNYPKRCLAGIMMVSNECCPQCARSEGQLCDVEPFEYVYGRCGPMLKCSPVHSGNKDEGNYRTENICKCLIDFMACGNDGNTYSSVCALDEENKKRENSYGDNEAELRIVKWGFCAAGPDIISEPTNVGGYMGDHLTLSCMASGYPPPSISWKYINNHGKLTNLPNDNEMFIVHTRGGPRRATASGWVQIYPLEANHMGMYMCMASNEHGIAYKMASVNVYNRDYENNNKK